MEEFNVKEVESEAESCNATNNEYDELSKIKYHKSEGVVDEHIVEDSTRKASKAFISIEEDQRKEEEKMRMHREEELEREHLERECLDREYHVIETEDYIYKGYIVNSLKSGFGICYYRNGDVYIGQWLNDVKHGYGRLTIKDRDEIIQGELINDQFEGYCEKLIPTKNYSIKGYYLKGNFIDYVIVHSENYGYEGEAMPPRRTSSIKPTLGKLFSTKVAKRCFFGEILDYSKEYGYGILIKNHNIYIGESKNGLFQNYIEMFQPEYGYFFGFLNKGKKHGISFSISKDSKAIFGFYNNDIKQGPFIHFSNSSNLNKSSVKMEMYHLGFKSKVVEKLDASKKYLNLFYPEFADIFKIKYIEILEKLNNSVIEEGPLIQQFLNDSEDKTNCI